MDKVFKTSFLLIYLFGLVFLVILQERWGKKDVPARPVFADNSRNCQYLECILREKNLVLGALDKSWNLIRDKRLFPDWDDHSPKK
ncbi:hypothetical protein [Leptospira sarikeiensis]|uniref:Uncharacterized protein n=1 Tax=Leptospira sarikeiensis TaxID=2484943 RepID=A0A4R9K5W9_9LEPT|nr:hypothetical protein [Leptospira sarikeiensis]TGL61638.1 hypothetical protein EHQ64_09730 [Leptospira sarikeiensis]